MGCSNSQYPRCTAFPSSLQNLQATIGYTCNQPPDETCRIKDTECSQLWSAPRKGDKPNLAGDTRQVENVRLSHNNCGLMQQPSKLGYRMGPPRNNQHLTNSKFLVTQGWWGKKRTVREAWTRTGSWARLCYVIDVPVWPPEARCAHRWHLSASQCIV